MMLGYIGKILNINLTTGNVITKTLNEDMARKYIGGIGLGMRIFLEYSQPGIDPFSPDNPLVLATGTSPLVPPTGNFENFKNHKNMILRFPAGCRDL